jgi:hypothetical protein
VPQILQDSGFFVHTQRLHATGGNVAVRRCSADKRVKGQISCIEFMVTCGVLKIFRVLV